MLLSQSNSNSCYLNNFFLIIQSIGLLLLVIRGVVFIPFLKEDKYPIRSEHFGVTSIITEPFCLTLKNENNYDPNEKNVPSGLGTEHLQ